MLLSARRDILMLGAAAAGAALLPSSANAQDKFIKDKVRIYGRARGAPKGQIGMQWYTGKLWAKRTYDSAVQLFTVHGFSFNRMELNGDGSLLQNMIEVGFWCDPGTFKPADAWTNPINGLPCKPAHYKSSQKFTFDAQGNALRPADAPPVEYFKGIITDPVVQGDTLWIGEELIVKAAIPPPKTQPEDPLTQRVPIQTNTSLVMYTMKVKDVETPDSTWLPSTMNYQTMGPWYPWMRLGYEPGQLMFQLTGKKLKRMDEMPLALMNLINERHPGFLDNPGL
ncbi:MAG: DUF1838 family protein [Rhodospirillaceae bacterium]|nr:DUF1838 family protein [Rhodospirillaceae bacterium]